MNSLSYVWRHLSAYLGDGRKLYTLAPHRKAPAQNRTCLTPWHISYGKRRVWMIKVLEANASTLACKRSHTLISLRRAMVDLYPSEVHLYWWLKWPYLDNYQNKRLMISCLAWAKFSVEMIWRAKDILFSAYATNVKTCWSSMSHAFIFANANGKREGELKGGSAVIMFSLEA